MLESSTCTLIIQFNFNLKYPADSNCDSSTGACYNLVESKIPIPKFVVTICRLSFLWPLKRTVHLFYHSDNFALPFFRPMSLSMIVLAA